MGGATPTLFLVPRTQVSGGWGDSSIFRGLWLKSRSASVTGNPTLQELVSTMLQAEYPGNRPTSGWAGSLVNPMVLGRWLHCLCCAKRSSIRNDASACRDALWELMNDVAGRGFMGREANQHLGCTFPLGDRISPSLLDQDARGGRCWQVPLPSQDPAAGACCWKSGAPQENAQGSLDSSNHGYKPVHSLHPYLPGHLSKHGGNCVQHVILPTRAIGLVCVGAFR